MKSRILTALETIAGGGDFSDITDLVDGTETGPTALWHDTTSLAEHVFDVEARLATIEGQLVSEVDGYDLANYFDSIDAYPPFYYLGVGLCSYLSDLVDLVSGAVNDTAPFYVADHVP